MIPSFFRDPDPDLCLKVFLLCDSLPFLRQGQTFPWIYIDFECWALKNGSPRVNLQGMSDIYMVDLTDADLVPIDNVKYNSTFWTSLEAVDDYILQSDHFHSSCDTVESLFGRDENPGPTIFGRWNGIDLVFDPRLVLETNTIENPLLDGGGTAVVETNRGMECSNAPRTFLNEDSCVLSTLQTACSSKVPPVRTVKLNQPTLAKLSKLGQNVFAFVNIPITNVTYTDSDGIHPYLLRPCDPWTWTVDIRFKRVARSFCTKNPLRIQEKTRVLFAKFLKPEFDDPINPNPRYKTIVRHASTNCAVKDQDNMKLLNLGFLMGEDGSCWKHVHPLEGNIYGKLSLTLIGDTDKPK